MACADSIARRARIAELVAEADRAQFEDARFRRELASWIDPRRRVDGMPAFAAGVPALLDFASPVVTAAVRTFDFGNGLAALHHQLVGASPLLACIATARDDRDAWLAAGQALERMLLVAARAGYTASYRRDLDLFRGVNMIRHYALQRISADHVHTPFTVAKPRRSSGARSPAGTRIASHSVSRM